MVPCDRQIRPRSEDHLQRGDLPAPPGGLRAQAFRRSRRRSGFLWVFPRANKCFGGVFKETPIKWPQAKRSISIHQNSGEFVARHLSYRSSCPKKTTSQSQETGARRTPIIRGLPPPKIYMYMYISKTHRARWIAIGGDLLELSHGQYIYSYQPQGDDIGRTKGLGFPSRQIT